MSDKEMLFYAKAYRALTKATAEISNNSEDQKRFEIIDWLIEQAEKAEKYREALEFYADESNNEWDVDYYGNVEYSEVMIDGGQKARQALEESK